MEVIVLGCGFSLGCPVLGCSCPVCVSPNKYNKRTRSAILIRSQHSTILVDFGPDIKQQLLNHKITKLDAVICTHDHADHSSGIDELRVFGYKQTSAIPLYSDKKTIKSLLKKYNYLFKLHEGHGPFLQEEIITEYQKINISGIEFQFFKQTHGINSSLGFRIGNFVYSNDITEFPKKSISFLKNIETWLLDCVDYKRTKAHAGLAEVLTWQKQYQPKHILLTNMSHNLDYDNLKNYLPSTIAPAYDNLIIKL